MHSVPDLILQEPARHESLPPKLIGRLAVFREDVSKGDRRIDVGHRSARSASRSFINSSKVITGARGGGGIGECTRAGVISPFRTASAHKALPAVAPRS